MILGLDLETSGSDIELHVPLQIGIAISPARYMVQDIGWDSWRGTPEADAVHNISAERTFHAPRTSAVDEMVAQWLESINAPRRRCVPVGWNVSSFDMAFVRRYLPLTASTFFGHRGIDLNSICFALDGKPSTDATGHAVHPNWKTWKKRAKHYADAELAKDGVETQRHDAGHDARAAVLEYRWLKLQVGCAKG